MIRRDSRATLAGLGRPFGRRILLLSAHPDDEVVGCAAAIGRARSGGAQVFVLHLTHGCIPRDQRWPWARSRHHAHVARRRTEAEVAAGLLAITLVGCSNRPARSLWRALPEVAAEAVDAIHSTRADQLWVPAYEGGNPDHDGLNAVGCHLAPMLRAAVDTPGAAPPPVLEVAEYNFAGDRARSQTFPDPDGRETTLCLSAAEVSAKRAALAVYASERRNLGYVGLARECFRPLAARDYRQPPHAGTLWYQRFGWVPFRHPRLDRTDPSEVSAAITAFLA